MSTNTSLRKQFSGLRKKPGPSNGWQAKAARDLGFSKGYISKLVNGHAKSPAALAMLKAWKQRRQVA